MQQQILFDSNTCRLCQNVAPSPEHQIRCFGAIMQLEAEIGISKKCTVAEILVKHFWFELHIDRDADAIVCKTCWSKVVEFHEFYQTVFVRYKQRWQSHFKTERTEFDPNEGQHVKDQPADEFDLKYEDSDDGEEDDNDGNSFDGDDGGIKTEKDATASATVSRHRRKRGHTSKSDNPKYDIKIEPSPDVSNASIATTPTENADDDDDVLVRYFTLQCDLCDAPIESLAAARAHHQKEHKQRGYLMCGCGKRFSREDSIREHCAFHSDSSQHKCIDCSRIFTNAAWLASHNRRKHSDEAATTIPEDYSDRHNDENNPNKRVKQRRNDDLLRRYMSMFCDLCGDSFGTFEDGLIHHKLFHTGPGYVVCCGKKYRRKPRAVLHCHWHENPRQFDCTQCGRNFAGSACLRRHMEDHHPAADMEFSFPCDECDRSFQLQTQLRIHKRLKHTPKEEMRYECYACHKRYRCLSHLRYHLRDVHYNTGPSHVCDVCAKSFHSKTTYELHYALEHGTESMRRQCQHCGKWLKHARGLKRHMTSKHTAGRTSAPAACDQCAHVASSSKALYVHRRLAHREPAYKCLVCDKRFKTKTVLREHSAIHAGIKDLYTCAYCPQTFRSGANMYKHRRQRHAAQLEMDRRIANMITDETSTTTAAAKTEL